MTRSYKLLGSLEIEENGRPAPLMKSKKGCAIHAYLIVQGEEKPRAELANLLWKSSTKNSRLGNLRRILGLIRQIAPELVVTRQTLAFQSSATTQVDYQQLQTALLQAKTDQLKTDQLQQLDQGLQQYKGDLLATFYLEDAPNFNEWLTVAREQLRGQVWDAYQRLCAAYFEGQTWEAGIAAARRWVQLDDLHEASHRWLIRFLLANGQHDAAQTQLETCRERLWEELGVEPEDETEALAEQLEASRAKTAVSPTPFIIPAPSAAWQPEPLPDPAKLADLGNLPPLSFLPYQREDNFTGRQDDLIQLGQRLLPWDVPPQSPPKGRKLAPLPLGGAGGGKAVAITGMGGLGKTQLAVEFAHRYGRFFEGGVYWLSFAEPESVPEAVAAIGGESGMRLFRHIEKLTLGDQIGRVQQAWQAPKPRLLIFDNCEDETLFEKWRPVSGGCRVLLTSRRNAWAPELDIAHFPLQSLPRAESIALLKQMLAGKISTAAAAAIAAEVGDLPLALHMAGRFLQRFPQIDASRYLTQLREQTPLSHPSLAGDAAPSGRGVARTFALNFEQLMVADEVNAVAQRLLIHAACFAPGEPIPQQLLLGSLGDDEDDFMAELLAEDGLFRLGSLGFVEAKGQDVVVVHRLIAAFVQDAFAKAENANQAGLLAVADYLIGKLKTHFQRDAYTGQLPFAAVHLRHLVNRLLPQKNEQGVALAALWGSYLTEIVDYETAVSTLNAALAIDLGATHSATGAAEQAIGWLYFHQGAYELARPAFERAVAIFEQTEGKTAVKTATVLMMRGNLASRLRSFAAAETDYRRALHIFSTQLHAEHPFSALAHHNLGILYNRQGLYAAALQHYERALSILERTLGKNYPSALEIRNSLGVTYWRQGNYVAAELYFAQTLATRKELFGLEHPRTANSLNNMGVLKERLGALTEAQSLLEQAVAIRRKLFGDDHPQTARALSNLAATLVQLGESARAQRLLEQALTVQRQVYGVHAETADSLFRLGNLLLNQGDIDGARPHLTEALTSRQQLFAPDHADIGRSLLSLGRLTEAERGLAAAKELYEQALDILEGTAVPEHPDFPLLRQRLTMLDGE